MTRHGPALLALSVLAIAGWTYNVNYDTRAALDRLSELRAEIAEEREALQVLHVEWAWLNAPDRLARLTVEHNDRLGLIALTPEALGQVAAVPYPRGVPERHVPPVPPEALVAAAPGVVPPPLAAEDTLTGTDAPGLTIAAAPDEGGIDTAALEPAGASTAPAVAGTLRGEAGPAIAAAARAAGIAIATVEKPVVAALADPVIATAGSVLADAAAVPAADPVLAAPAAAAALTDPVVAAAAEKAEAIAPAPAAPSTMQEAVTLALVEAGVVEPGAGSGPAAVFPASAAPIPVPPARPALWSHR